MSVGSWAHTRTDIILFRVLLKNRNSHSSDNSQQSLKHVCVFLFTLGRQKGSLASPLTGSKGIFQIQKNKAS